ncbi:hypothetical protein, partial [Acinetobacter baumannii]
MKTRIISGLILLPLLLLIVYGGIPLYIAEFLVVGIALHEFYKAFEAKEIEPVFIVGYIFAAYLAIKNIFNLPLMYTYAM